MKRKAGDVYAVMTPERARALEAVAREAKTLGFYPAQYEGYACMGVSGNTDQLRRALDRLARLSSPPRRPRGILLDDYLAKLKRIEEKEAPPRRPRRKRT